MKFTRPDEGTIRKMTVRSIEILLDTLRTQRAEIVKPLDSRIEFYEEILKKKKGSDGQATS